LISAEIERGLMAISALSQFVIYGPGSHQAQVEGPRAKNSSAGPSSENGVGVQREIASFLGSPYISWRPMAHTWDWPQVKARVDVLRSCCARLVVP